MEHPWMVGSVTVVDYPVDVMGDDDDIAEYESDDSFDNETYERESYNQTSKSHAKSILENQRMFGKYKVTVDWIRVLPAVNEINGIEILISDTTKKSSHGSSGGCGGEDHGDDKGKHGDSMKGKSGHECECPHFKMVKR
ncbi:MAG: hypothetical protein OER82_04315 [Nitrosopumilus sp.]|nr:hypothetical protein [Nitrosopumilus sp.]